MGSSGLELLLTREGFALLSSLPPYEEQEALRLGTGLRERGVDPDLVAAAMTQSRLRARAQAKFGEFAQHMLFTPEGLQQATRLEVAALHAERYAAAGVSRMADLGCGIGGDAMAMAGLGIDVLAVDSDEETAAAATVNLSPFPGAQVRHGDAMTLHLEVEGVGAAFADPARRTRRGTRVFDPRSYTPDLDTVLELRHRVALGVKVGPGIPYRALPSQTQAQWVSVDGDVVEAGLWFGALAPEGAGRSALVLAADGEGHRRAGRLAWAGDADAPVRQAPSGRVQAYLYEPDGAVIRAGLVAMLAEQIEGTLLDPSIAYVSTPAQRETPFATGYRVLDHFDFGLKRLRAYLRERDVGRVTIKKRGSAIVPEQLRQQLALKGSREATIVVTRIAGRQSVLVVEPVGRI